MRGGKLESAAICRGCLSTDRKLSSLTNNKSYFNLLTDKQKEEAMMDSEIRVCWECTAALNRMQLFQAQAQKAHMVLEESLDNPASLRSLSTLTSCHKHSYDSVLYEIEDEELPIKKDKLSVGSSDVMNKEDCTDIEDSYHHEEYAALSSEEEIMTDEFKQTRKIPVTVQKNKQQKEIINNNIPVINTKIKVKRLVENEEYNNKRKCTKQIITKRAPSSRIKKPVLRYKNNLVITTKKKTLKRKASPVQFRQGIRRSKRISKIVEEKKDSNQCNVEISSYIEIKNVELTKGHNANDFDIASRDDVDLCILNKDGLKNEEVKANKIDFFETENANKTGNGGRDNVYLDGKYVGSERLEAASGTVLEQSEESKEDESNEVLSSDFRRTIVDYDDYDDLDTYFTKMELTEEETKAALEKEPKYVTKELPYNCDYCGICFQLHRTMHTHMKQSHKQLRKALHHVNPNIYYCNSMYRCNLCPTVLRQDQTVAHMRYVHRIRYYCKHCDMDFWNKKDCKRHLTANHSRFDCDLCSESRPSWKLLEKHKRHNHKIRKCRADETLQCEECGKKIRSKFYLIAHQEKWHPREGTDTRFHCMLCKLTLRSKENYKWHLKYSKAHNPNAKVPRVACPECGKLYKKHSLKSHYDRFHTDKTDFQCKICGKYLARKGRLEYHINRVHLKIPLPKDKLCTICGREFSSNRTLLHHIRTHTGERPFACALCPAAFAQPWPLKKHTNAHHSQHNTNDHRQREVKPQSLDEVVVESQSQDEHIAEG